MTTELQIEHVFCEQVLLNGALWTIQDEKGIPTPLNSENIRSMPFWSIESAAENFIQSSEGYSGFTVLKVELDVFKDKWAQGMHQDGLCMGINWQSSDSQNVDIEVAELIDLLKKARA